MKKIYMFFILVISMLQVAAQCHLNPEDSLIILQQDQTDRENIFNIEHQIRIVTDVATTPAFYSLSFNHSWINEEGDICSHYEAKPDQSNSNFIAYGRDSIFENGVVNFSPSTTQQNVTINTTSQPDFPANDFDGSSVQCVSRSQSNTCVFISDNPTHDITLQSAGFVQTINPPCRAEGYSFCIAGVRLIDDMDLGSGDVAFKGSVNSKKGGKGGTILQKGGSNDPVVCYFHDSVANTDTSVTIMSVNLNYDVSNDTAMVYDYWKNDSLNIESGEAVFKIIFPTTLTSISGSFIIKVSGDTISQVIKTGFFSAVATPAIGTAVPFKFYLNDSLNFHYNLSSLNPLNHAGQVKILIYNNCENVNVMDSTVLIPVLVPVSPICPGANNGAILCSVSGGASPYTFAWSTGATTQNISGVTTGIYTVTVSSSCGYSYSASVTVAEPNPINTVASVQNVSCKNSSNGSVVVSVSGGTAPYVFVWSNGITNAAITNLNAGVYTVTITDANGCTTSASATILQPSASIVLTVSRTNIRCGGKCTGKISVSPSGGWNGYSYLWNNGATTISLNNLCAGVYTVTVTDASGCTKTKSIAVTQNPALVVLVAPTGPASATVTSSGGVAPYVYLWNTVPQQTTATATGLMAGNTYKARVTEIKNCTKVVSVTMPSPKTNSYTDEAAINVFPNPSSGIINLTIDIGLKNDGIEIDVFNCTGQIVFRKCVVDQSREIQIDLSNQPKGIYCLRTTLNGKYLFRKIVIK